jgi:hypothetical protein
MTDRFWEKVDKTDTCWLWTGSKADTGYGTFYVERGVYRSAHRLSVEMAGREIPDGMWIDHLCRVRSCVNPTHLDIVEPRENSRRGMAPTWITVRMDVCHRGHSMEDASLAHRSDGRITRRCRTCRRQRETERREARRLNEVCP